MNKSPTPATSADAALDGDEFDTAVVPWSLDELESSTDLGALRSAWTACDDLGE